MLDHGGSCSVSGICRLVVMGAVMIDLLVSLLPSSMLIYTLVIPLLCFFVSLVIDAMIWNGVKGSN